ncbi:cutinase family protein [Corynebacterium sp.]|uniref:cutinase family protein n=1 Tax=Corynebacterium sp. TaxID=1720 RepID=UPI0026DD3D88|nr:cutinase family protein [Corynebacterium sp.]MDO5031082.1 cutinase family protein [Corynebacterium sp.]
MIRKALSCAAAALMAASLAVPAASAGQPDASEQCPAVVVLAARGSDQNEEQGEYFGPQRYSENSQPSNGFEGPNFSAFFRQVEQRHPGTMDNVFVLAMDDQAYPATVGLPPLAKEGEELSPQQILQRLVEIVQNYPVGQLLYNSTFGFFDSVRAGMGNAPKVVEEYEKATGCRPRYITAGFSQGAIVSTSVEKYLADTGRLEAAVNIGNPLHKHPWVIQRAALPADKRVDYCLSGDFVCDLTPAAAADALATKAERHASYFREDPTAEDAAVVDTFAGWVKHAPRARGE